MCMLFILSTIIGELIIERYSQFSISAFDDDCMDFDDLQCLKMFVSILCKQMM